jgi:hypothetical protein
MDSMLEPRKSRRTLTRQARAALIWGLALYAIGHVGLLIVTQWCWPRLRDPEYSYKLTRLRKQIAAQPQRPLLVLLGSSRTGQGFRPAKLPDCQTPDGRTPFVFNFSQVGSGPIAELVCLRRLLAEGIRPDWLAIEVLPALLGRKIDASCGNPEVGVSRLTWNDLFLLLDYTLDPRLLKRNWYGVQLAPWYGHRFSIMNHYASEFLPWRLRLDCWKALDDWGWSDLGLDTDEPEKEKETRALQLARDTYEKELKDFQIEAVQNRALREMLALCRREGIPTILYLMPEGSIFRSWYVPPTRARIEDYLTHLSEEFNVPIVDARNWIADEYFGDSHHLYRLGATIFTRRFGEEVLPSLLAGKLDQIRPILAPARKSYPEKSPKQEPVIEARGLPTRSAPPTLSIKGGVSSAPPPQ